jgi:hypothetical protein
VASNYIGDARFVAPEILREGVEHMVETALEAACRLQTASPGTP